MNLNEDLEHILDLTKTQSFVFRRINRDAIQIVEDSFPVLKKDKEQVRIIAFEEHGLCTKRAIEYRGIKVAEWEVCYNGEEVFIRNMKLLADNSELELARQIAESDAWKETFAENQTQ